MTRLVLLGGGHAHLAVLESLAREPIPGLSAQLVSPEPRAIYSGMLPGWVSGHYGLDECAIDLRPLAAAARVELHFRRATAVDAMARTVSLEGGSSLAYDVLAMASRLRRDIPEAPPHVRILTDEPDIVPTLPALARAMLRRRLDAAGVGVHGHCPVREVGRDFIRAGEAITFANDAAFWVTGAAPQRFLRDSGLRVDARGFISVNACQQSESHAEVFAAGDCATRADGAVPKSGVFAVRSGPALATNLRAYLAGQPLQAHRSRRLHLALLATGEGSAVGAWGALSFSGQWVGRWKDRIDREFIARYASPKPGLTG